MKTGCPSFFIKLISRPALRLSPVIIACCLLANTGCGSSSHTTITVAPPAPNLVYVANRDSQDISAFTADSSGALTPVSGSPFTTTSGVNNIAVNPTGTLLYASAYDSSNVGTVWAFTIAPATGVLSPVAGSPYSVLPVPLSLVFNPAGSLLFVGAWESEAIHVFSVNTSTGALTEIPNSPFPVPGGPRILAMHPSGNFLFVANDGNNSIDSYSIDSTGNLTQIANSPDSDLNQPWGIAVSPDGNYLYAVDESGMTAVEGFSIASDGTLTTLPNSPYSIGGAPLWITVDPSGSFAYSADFFSNNVSGMTIDSSTGELTQMPTSPFVAGSGTTSPAAVAVNSRTTLAYVAYYGINSVGVFPIDTSGSLGVSTSTLVSVGTGPVAVTTAIGQP